MTIEVQCGTNRLDMKMTTAHKQIARLNRRIAEHVKKNGTPYSDEQWKQWYTNHKSSDELEVQS